jgi:hypothetical protein
MLGTLNFHRLVPRPAPPTSSPPSEMVRVEVPRVAYVEESALGAPVREKMAEALARIRAVGANASLCTDGGRMNGAEPQPEDAPSWATLIPGTSKGPSFSLSREATFNDATPIPRSFDIVDLGTGEPGLPGYP